MDNTEKERLQALATEWRGIKEIKDLGGLGAALKGDGYDEQGFRPLRLSEEKLLRLCAEQLDALLVLLAERGL